MGLKKNIGIVIPPVVLMYNNFFADGPVKRPVILAPTVHGPRLTTAIGRTTTSRPIERPPLTTLSQVYKTTSAAARGTSASVSEPGK